MTVYMNAETFKGCIVNSLIPGMDGEQQIVVEHCFLSNVDLMVQAQVESIDFLTLVM